MMRKTVAKSRDRASTTSGATSRPRYSPCQTTPSGSDQSAHSAASGAARSNAERATPRTKQLAIPASTSKSPGCTSSDIGTLIPALVVRVRTLEYHAEGLGDEHERHAG